MKQFAFISTNWIKKCYDFVLSKQKNHQYFLDILKISGWIILILICLLFYLRYISLSSTEWYFYRKASEELSALQFKYEISKTEIMEKTQKNRDSMYSNNQTKTIIDVRTELVQLPEKTELTYK
jgi:hypothetical protein